MRTPKSEIDKRYEEKHKAERKAAHATFGTSIPRQDLEEINDFLKVNDYGKIDLIYAGWRALATKKRTVDCLLMDMIELIKENIDELKGDNSEIAFGQRLAYVECLEIIKGEIMGDEAAFGLDGDLDKKFGLIK